MLVTVEVRVMPLCVVLSAELEEAGAEYEAGTAADELKLAVSAPAALLDGLADEVTTLLEAVPMVTVEYQLRVIVDNAELVDAAVTPPARVLSGGVT